MTHDIEAQTMQTPFAAIQKNQEPFNIQLKNLNNSLIILYFYPKDDTPGCTIQAQDFSEQYALLTEKKVAIVGVSKDSLKSHDAFINKFNLPFALIADTDATLCHAFNVIKLKNLFGKQVQGIERSTFVLTPQGEVLKEWRKVSAKEHVHEVMAYINSR